MGKFILRYAVVHLSIICTENEKMSCPLWGREGGKFLVDKVGQKSQILVVHAPLSKTGNDKFEKILISNFTTYRLKIRRL